MDKVSGDQVNAVESRADPPVEEVVRSAEVAEVEVVEVEVEVHHHLGRG